MFSVWEIYTCYTSHKKKLINIILVFGYALGQLNKSHEHIGVLEMVL